MSATSKARRRAKRAGRPDPRFDAAVAAFFDAHAGLMARLADDGTTGEQLPADPENTEKRGGGAEN